MPESDAQPEQLTQDRRLVLLTGATGYIGSRLLPLLEQREVRVRCLARNPDKLEPEVGVSTEIVKGLFHSSRGDQGGDEASDARSGTS